MKCNPWVGGSIGRRGFPMLGTGKRGLSAYVRGLFSNGEQGFFYDPNDLSTMYQDAAGSVPVTGVGQAVGLMLDKSKGVALGTNVALVSKLTGQGIGGGEFKTGAVSHYLEAGAWYKVTINVSNYSGTGDVGVTGTNTSFPTSSVSTGIRSRSSNGLISFIALAQTSNTVVLYTRSSNNADFTDITIQKISGNHAYQTTSASRPILRQNAVTGAYYLAFDGTDDFLQTAVSLPFPVTAVAPFDFKSKDAIKCILSSGATGYLRSTETVASVHTVSGSNPSANKQKVDVLLHELTGDSINIRTNADGIMMSNVDIPAKNPYLALNKYIGSFSDTHTVLRAAMDLYGMVVIRKMLSTREEAEIRAHFNKRMGI